MEWSLDWAPHALFNNQEFNNHFFYSCYVHIVLKSTKNSKNCTVVIVLMIEQTHTQRQREECSEGVTPTLLHVLEKGEDRQ